MSRAIDGKSFINISATTAAFQLDGGKYGVDCVGSGFGTVTLQKLGADGTTYVTALTAFAANGYATADLPTGTYTVAVASATAVYVNIRRIEGE
jgi:hypothetical protein